MYFQHIWVNLLVKELSAQNHVIFVVRLTGLYSSAMPMVMIVNLPIMRSYCFVENVRQRAP
jgi:hypothetical protein